MERKQLQAFSLISNVRCVGIELFTLPDVQPTPDEEVVHKEVQAILDQSNAILDELDEYKGAGDHIRTVTKMHTNLTILGHIPAVKSGGSEPDLDGRLPIGCEAPKILPVFSLAWCLRSCSTLTTRWRSS